MINLRLHLRNVHGGVQVLKFHVFHVVRYVHISIPSSSAPPYSHFQAIAMVQLVILCALATLLSQLPVAAAQNNQFCVCVIFSSSLS
jgi:hypothetical protein